MQIQMIAKASWMAYTALQSLHKSPGFQDIKASYLFHRKEYKSEYKKQFRPFSQYEYVDGRFLKKKGDQESGTGSPWYKEVIELRKKAGEYRVCLQETFSPGVKSLTELGINT